MKKCSIIASSLLVFTAITATADTIGGEIAIGGWNHEPSGWIRYPSDTGDKVYVDDDLNLDTQTGIYIRAKLEHPLPILPNIRLAYNNVKSEGYGKISKSFTFGDATFNANEKTYSKVDLDSFDGTFYWEVIDTGMDLDLGLTARYVNGSIKIKSLTTGRSDDTDIDVVLPLVYANIRVPVPFLDGLSIGAEGNYITYDGSTLYDLQADLRYTLTMGVGIEAGYRAQKYKLDDVQDTSSDIDFKGFFAGAVWDF
ncbi:TIGR04219 family outer membrane beta-barrel protein [Hydrogenimonas sp.]